MFPLASLPSSPTADDHFVRMSSKFTKKSLVKATCEDPEVLVSKSSSCRVRANPSQHRYFGSVQRQPIEPCRLACTPLVTGYFFEVVAEAIFLRLKYGKGFHIGLL